MNTEIGFATTNPDIHIIDQDFDFRDKEIGYQVLYDGEGMVELELERDDGVTRATAVKIIEAFDFETLPGAVIGDSSGDEPLRKQVIIPIEFSNPESDHQAPTVAQCKLLVENINERPGFMVRLYDFLLYKLQVLYR